MRTSIKRRLVVGLAAGALMLSVAVGFAGEASAGRASMYETQSISWCRSC